MRPDFVDEKNHNKKYWGPSAIQYINDHFGAEEAKAEEKTTQAEEKTTEVEGKVEAAEVVEAAKTEEKQEQASQVEDENKEETTAEEEVKEVVEEEKSAAEEVKEDDKPAGPRFIKKRRARQRKSWLNTRKLNCLLPLMTARKPKTRLRRLTQKSRKKQSRRKRPKRAMSRPMTSNLLLESALTTTSGAGAITASAETTRETATKTRTGPTITLSGGNFLPAR